jgi:hypothetical protein
METKRLVIGIVLSMALFIGWYGLTTYVDRKYGPPPKPADAAAVAPQPGVNTPSVSQPSTSPGGTPALSAGPDVLEVLPATDSSAPALVELGSAARKDATYA